MKREPDNVTLSAQDMDDETAQQMDMEMLRDKHEDGYLERGLRNAMQIQLQEQATAGSVT